MSGYIASKLPPTRGSHPMSDQRATAYFYKYAVKRLPDASLSKISLRPNVASGIVWQIATNCFDLALINPKR